MDNREEVRDFLRSRRARITPEQAGLPTYGSNRRVPGLRREEVAMLAGMSSDYYIRLERGNLGGASDQVLDALARVLRLDDAEQRHLSDLAAAARGPRSRRARTPDLTVPTSIRVLLDSITGTPAVVRDDRLTVLATNPLGRALYHPLVTSPAGPANHARFVFLDPASQDFWVNWERAADDTVGVLRSAAGRMPHDRELNLLIGELSTRSEDFRTRWAAHHVHLHTGGVKQIRHPVVGRVELMYDSLSIAAAPDLTLLVYTAQPGSPSADALTLLASWSVTEGYSQYPGSAGTPLVTPPVVD
ncbi:helix-turn-helix transcriptional regulator [Cellulomonas taurus]|uniref:helix-turn-helix transcriptional regulator n=1 Tax=Cellulomonas taurus TaxID=2729175 RepID=UPI00145D46FC|nr:helix-turn-helix transcriptional regulator [Cellulomonas taurus]